MVPTAPPGHSRAGDGSGRGRTIDVVRDETLIVIDAGPDGRPRKRSPLEGRRLAAIGLLALAVNIADAQLIVDDFDDHTTEVSCVECHMRPIVFSAVSSEPYVADVKSHIINVGGLFADTMFDETGDFLKLDENGKAVISIEYTCMVCHQSGKSASPLPSGILEAGYRVHRKDTRRELDP